jgi:iron(III) transport system ATP-binding protein
MSLLTIRNLSKKYSGQKNPALDNISLELNEEEILVVVGENGAGKTTFLKLINGLEDPDSGEILFRGEKVKGPSSNLVPGHQQIKMLYQEFNLLPHHTISENIGYNIRFYSDDDQSSIIGDLVKLCRLEGLENKLPAELSGGQQQRVALAKAIADDPLLILMDEPFSNLDLFLRDEIKKKVIRRLKAEGSSAIIVTHDLRDALSLSDRIAVLQNGKLLQIDEPKKVYEKPVNEYVAYLFGKVNILEIKEFEKIFNKENIFSDRISKNSTRTKVCIRPEHIQICKEEKAQLKVQVESVFYQGDSYEVEAKAGNMIIRINTRKKNISTGDKIFIRINPSRLHFI